MGCADKLAKALGIDQEPNDPYDDEREDPAGFTKDFLQRTSLHGLQYIGENNRSLCERIFWVVSFCVGMFGASYFILALYDKWENSPVYISVETTSYAVPNIPFPAISICSVNKLQEDRLSQSLDKIKEGNRDFDGIDINTLHMMLDAMIRYDSVNTSDAYIGDLEDIPPQELLKLFKSAMPPCKDMLAFCSWSGYEIPCLRLFKVMTTDDGFCCVFNAYSQDQVMNEESAKTPDDFSFLDDSAYSQVICSENAVNCTSGWIGGDYDDWVEEENIWHPDEKDPPSQFPPGNNPPPNKRRKREDSDDDDMMVVEALEVPQYAMGAGDAMGLKVMLYAAKDKYFLTSAFFEGFKVLVHHPEEFPAVRDRGFVVGPGQEMFVSIDAHDVYGTSSIRDISSAKRACLFRDERKLKHYLNYTRSNCIMECQQEAILKLCGCQPYFFPCNI